MKVRVWAARAREQLWRTDPQCVIVFVCAYVCGGGVKGGCVGVWVCGRVCV